MPNNMDNVYKRYKKGNDFLVDLTMTSETGHHLGDVDWECEFFTDGDYRLSIPKSKSFEVGNDHYLCPVVSRNFNEGILQADLKVGIPSPYFEDGVKNEIVKVELDKIYIEE